MFFPIFRQMKKQLAQVDKWLDKATEHAKKVSFDPSVYLGLRLAPDQFVFAKQVALTCDTAKLAASRLTGKDAPASPDIDASFDELRARLKLVTTFLDSLTEKDFAESATRSITQPRWEGKTMTGVDYFLEHALPNFYFHLAHTYAILRHAGVNVGKRDYLGALTQKPPAG